MLLDGGSKHGRLLEGSQDRHPQGHLGCSRNLSCAGKTREVVGWVGVAVRKRNQEEMRKGVREGEKNRFCQLKEI